ncbi:MAG: hypothetical protein C5B55_11260 [Blastocatellia bacterium]|nr:MAG: hypothetical protein C5B55_11260 [Blastocatellia bacterium]
MAQIRFDEIDAVFFDFGGTLAGMDFVWVAQELLGLNVFCSATDLARADIAVRRTISAVLKEENPADILPRYLTEILSRTLNESTDRIPDLVSTLAINLRPQGKDRKLWSNVYAETRQSLIDCSELGLRMAVVSNSDGTIEEGIRALGLREFFDVVVDSAVVGYAKPDPMIFQFALDAVGVEANRAIHVGDMYSADVLGARAAGVHPVLLDPGDEWRDADCVRVPSLSALVARLRSTRS